MSLSALVVALMVVLLLCVAVGALVVVVSGSRREALRAGTQQPGRRSGDDER